jgi:hypothetical protein
MEIPPYLAFSIMIILSFLLAWFTVSSAWDIAEKSKEMPAFNIQARTQKQTLTEELVPN